MIRRFAARVRAFLRGFVRFGPRRTLNAAFNYLEYWLRRDRVSTFPVALDLEVTSRCPLACVHCPRTHRDELGVDFPVQDADYERLLDLVLRLRGVRRINFQGLGESLQFSRLFELIGECRRLGYYTAFSTSAAVVTSRILEGFRCSPPHLLTFSCDTVEARLDEGVRENLSLDRFRQNVRKIVEAVRGAGAGTELLMHTCLVGENHTQLADIVRFAAELGIPSLDISELNLSYLEHVRDRVLPADREEALASVERARGLGDELGVRVAFTPQRELPESERRGCSYLWQHPYVTADGGLTPCCARPFSVDDRVGDAFARPFEEIWNGPEMQRLRRMHTRGETPELCRGCPYSPGGSALGQGDVRGPRVV